MFSPSPVNNGRSNCGLAVVSLLTTCFLLLLTTRCSCADSMGAISKAQSATPASTITAEKLEGDDTYFERALQDVGLDSFTRISASLKLKLLGVDVRPVCKAALRRTFRAFENFEPWALRLFDATGKYPTGLFQATRADLGAFDECIETEVLGAVQNELSRGQYCTLELSFKNFTIWERIVTHFSDVMHPRLLAYKDLLFHIDTHHVRLGICLLDDCTQQDVQALVNTVKPSVMNIQVSNCITARPEPWTGTQKAVIIFLCFLAMVVTCATSVDFLKQSNTAHVTREGWLSGFVTAFSAVANTRELLHTAEKIDPSHRLQFLHGMRFFSEAHIVFAHMYLIVSDVWALPNFLFVGTDHWAGMIVTVIFNSAGTMFFLSGFFLCSTVMAQRINGPVVFVVTLLRRLTRLCIQLFFVIMCVYALPCFVIGPNTKSYFDHFYVEIAEDWWRLLFQIRNISATTILTTFVHTWHLSVDFQLYAVSLLVLLVLKNRKAMALGALAALSLLGCFITAWTVANSEITPFMTFPAFKTSTFSKTLNDYYVLPSYHAVCYFSGCITFLIVDDFRRLKMSLIEKLAGWCVAISCFLCVVLMKAPWYKSPDPATEIVKILAAVSDRVLWSFFIAWVTLACSTDRGGAFGRFLSWNAFVPLSKLSFGVYLIHVPFLKLMLNASRERLYVSHFTQVTLYFGVMTWSHLLAYLSFLLCEAPRITLEKSASRMLTGRGRNTQRCRKRRPDTDDASKEEKSETSHVHSQ